MISRVLLHSSIIFLLISCVSASDGWDDFANNLATDLAPLITLFGEQITKQFLSESISILDDFIFCLAPLGVITAVVSAIRVYGNSSLRAFIGRGQEDPGTAERELLSCVSDSTAEVFSKFGVSRIIGKPAILEVVVTKSKQADGSSQVTLRTVTQASGLKGAENPADYSPNLMLNKGIKRRSRFLFYAAAQFGVLLQLGIIVYAALTVFMWPDTFRKNGNRAASYAFPFFVSGTLLLSIGMFSCAWLIERSSCKRYYKFDQKSSIYWIQPGGQEIGDQVYEAFAGKSDNRLEYVRSVRSWVHPEQNYRKFIHLVLVVCCSMTGFIFQFIGLRGLHSSVILGQLGSTMLMTVVRTALRTERINESDNLLINERALISSYQQELDWFTFHLLELKSFNVRYETYQDEGSNQDLVKIAIDTRVRLAELAISIPTTSLPIRTMATKLAKVMEDTLTYVTRWWFWNSDKDRVFLLVVPIECDSTNGHGRCCNYTLTLYKDERSWEVNSLVLESILGLRVWSLIFANRNMEFGNWLFRVIDLGYDDLPRLRRLYYKWITKKRPLDQRESLRLFIGSETFGAESSTSGNFTKHNTLLTPATPDLVTLVAQDLYILFLKEVAEHMFSIKGNTSIEGDDIYSYRGRHEFIQDLQARFVEHGLGSEEDALVCIVPELEKRNLLPDLTMNNLSLRKQVENLIKDQIWDKAIDLAQWMLAVSEPHCLQSSAIEYGYILLRCFMEPREELIALAAMCIVYPQRPTSTSAANFWLGIPDNVRSPISVTWWQNFRDQLLCLSWNIALYEAIFLSDGLRRQKLLSKFRSHGDTPPIQGTLGRESIPKAWRYLLSVWFNHSLDDEEATIGRKMCLDLLLQEDGPHAILEWLIIHYIRTSVAYGRGSGELISMIEDSVKREDQKLVLCVAKHESDLEGFHEIWDMVMERLIRDGDCQALDTLLHRFNSKAKPEEVTAALFYAVDHNQVEVARHILQKEGVNINVRDPAGDTALTLSILNKCHPMVELLLDMGANINARSLCRDGKTALMIATQLRDLPLVKYLLDRGADVHIQANDQRTALDIARPWTEGIELLTAAGATSQRDHGGCS